MRRLIAKGYELLFEMHDGRNVEPPPSWVMLHDPEGLVWPPCSLLVMPFDASAKPLNESDSASRDYFGGGYRRHVGDVDTPPQSLDKWRRIGAVRRVFYWRDGVKYPGVFKHPFGKRTLATLFRSGEAVLYRHDDAPRAYRLELSSWCRLDDRGILAP